MSVVKVKQLSVEKPGQAKHGLIRDRKHMLVDKVNFDLNVGEILAIIGPNGAGKSTLIKALAGDMQHTGEVIISGLAATPIQRARQIAVLPQLSLLNFPYRVSEVVNLARIPHRSGWVRDQQVVDEALSLMDIKFLKDRFYTELSGGEKQRVQLARALAQIWDASDAAHGTRLLLLDEPTTALDLGHQRDLMLAVQKFAKQGVAVVMVLHDINLAARYANTMLALLCSEQIAYGSVEQVVTADNISRLFGIQAEIVKHPKSDTPVVIGI